MRFLTQRDFAERSLIGEMPRGKPARDCQVEILSCGIAQLRGSLINLLNIVRARACVFIRRRESAATVRHA